MLCFVFGDDTAKKSTLDYYCIDRILIGKYDDDREKEYSTRLRSIVIDDRQTLQTHGSEV